MNSVPFLTDTVETRLGRAERSAANRSALVMAAREQFGARGFNAAGTTKIVGSAGLSLGALYHHFPGKAALFAAVLDQIETEVSELVARALDAGGPQDPLARLCDAVDAWIAAYTDPAVRQIVLVDAPAVLGPRHDHDRPSTQLMTAALGRAMDTGVIPRQSAVVLAHLLVAAVAAAARYAAGSANSTEGVEGITSALHHFIRSLGMSARPEMCASSEEGGA